MRSLVTLLIAFAASAGGTFLFIRWARSRQIVATENHRTMHKGAVPTGGGWAVIAAALAAALLIWPLGETHAYLLMATLVLLALSWKDDLEALAPGLRLAVHVATAAAAVAILGPDQLVFQGYFPFVLDRVASALALVWFMNLYNFMDGIDGIAAVETVAVALGYAAITLAVDAPGPLYGLALATGAAAAGFLVWNWAPARIFLGDVGSIPLGFILGVLLLDLAVRHSLAAALILPLYFLVDASLTLARRLAKGARPWDAHRDHAYQRAAKGIGAHAPVTLRIAIANSLLMIVAMLALSAPLPALAIAGLIVAALLANLEMLARRAKP